MEEQLKELEREMPTIIRIINGYLSTNPLLANLEMDTLGVKKKKMPLAEFKDSIREEAYGCKICKNALGQEYCYYGPNGCPVF